MNSWLFWLFWFHVFKWELLELLCSVCACACVWVLTYVEATPPWWNLFFFIHLHPSIREDFSECVFSNAWVSGGVCRCTPSVMQWQWIFFSFLCPFFSSWTSCEDVLSLPPHPTWEKCVSSMVALFARQLCHGAALRLCDKLESDQRETKFSPYSSVNYCGLTFSILLMRLVFFQCSS